MIKKHYKRLLCFLLACLVLITLHSNETLKVDAATSEKVQGEVTATKLNIRSKPDTKSSVLGTYKQKQTIQYNKYTNTWGKVSYQGKTGYVSLTYVKKSTAVASVVNTKGYINASWLTVRSGAGTNYSALGSLKKDTTVEIQSVVNGWGKIKYNNKTGYISMKYIKYENPKTTTKEPVKTATANKIGYVTASELNIRANANASSKILGTVKKDESISVASVNKNWAKITYKKIVGYVSMDYVTYTAPKTSVKQPTTTPVKQPVATPVKEGYVTASELNIRANANASSKILGTVKKDESISVTSVNKNWAKITYKKIVGYVSMDYVTYTAPKTPVKQPTTTPVKQPAATPVKKGYVTADYLNVREKESTTSKVISLLTQNAEIEILSTNKTWGKIKTDKGTGYVSLAYISYDKPKTTKPTTSIVVDKVEYFVKASALNVRDKSNANGKILGTINNGSKLDFVKKESNGWIKIKYKGKDGYVSGDHVSTTIVGSESTVPSIALSNLKGKTIVVDAGHGGSDPGALGSGLKEKEFTLAMANKMKSKLESNGAKVILTRSTDVYVSLGQRTSISNNSDADAFISFHFNAVADSSARGVETFYHPSSNTSLKNKSLSLANKVHESLLKASTIKNRGVKTGNFQVIKYNQKPSILIEFGFGSNPTDLSFLKSETYRDDAINSVATGISNYLK